MNQATAAVKAEQGMVRIQAQTILPARPQRTALSFREEPTPTMAPVMVCVVDTGMPASEAKVSVMAPPVSAQKPPTGLILVSRQIAARDHEQPDDADGLLRIVGAMPEAVISGGEELQSAEPSIDAGRRCSSAQP